MCDQLPNTPLVTGAWRYVLSTRARSPSEYAVYMSASHNPTSLLSLAAAQTCLTLILPLRTCTIRLRIRF
ncbi:hypothetical protein BS47DRAFT_1354148, partial [Hydnum rufescens UP504]